MRLLDFRIAARGLSKQPGFTASAVIILAVAIGANTAIFSAVHAVLLRPPLIASPDRLVVMWESDPRRGLPMQEVSHRNFRDWREHSRSFDAMSAIGSVNWSMVLEGGSELTRMQAAGVSANVFDLMGVQPTLGRTRVLQPWRPFSAA